MLEIIDISLGFVTLTLLEIVLGIDNLVFLAILSQRLPKHLQKKARQLGLTLAWVTRLILLASVIWLTKLTAPLLSFYEFSFSGRDLFLIAGGLFLLTKSTQEIYAEIEPNGTERQIKTKYATFGAIIIQIALLDIVFSLDSVLTAIGLTQHFLLMAAAITIAIIAMIFASEPLSNFIARHPSVKMLGLSFLILIGMVLIADGFSFHIPRAYIYFAMGFSLLVETLNLIRKKRRKN
ncbi:MAG TPA: TerC family protein [Gammaproteobacteria bacterium]|jgi:predicted tellurium resistance membrane protein TerC|nr:TerC family protein [Gammaproteobacteria bacterium]